MTWQPLTLDSAKETQAALESLLGFNRTLFGMSSYLAQGNAGAFPEASPAERKTVLALALDPRGYWPDKAQKASDERKQAERALDADAIRIGERTGFITENAGIQERLDDASEIAIGANQDLAAADLAFARTQAEITANAVALERAKAAAQAETAARIERDRCQAILEEAQGKAAELEPARVEVAEAEQQAARVGELERLVEEQRQAYAEVALAERELEAASLACSLQRQNVLARERDYTALDDKQDLLLVQWNRLAHADNDHERCDRCEQLLGEEARLAAIASIDAERIEIGKAMTAKRAEITEAQRELEKNEAAKAAITIPELAASNGYDDSLRQARAAAERLSGLRERIVQLEAVSERLVPLAQALREAETVLERRAAQSLQAASEAQDDAELSAAAESARGRQRQARAALDEANAAVTRLEEQLARVRLAQTELDELRRITAVARDDLDLLRLAERAFGRDGIPTLIAENALGAIEAHANGYLAMMPLADGETLRVQLETQRAQKTVETLKEVLDVMVADSDGTRAFETFSGGERARVSIALRLALAILLADRRGAESRLLAIDEIEGLDSEGQRQLVDVVRSVASRFDCVLVASHYGGIRDAFDQQWQVVKEDGVSRLEAE